jgi:hypothetical protein
MSRTVVQQFRTEFCPPLQATDLPQIRSAISQLMDQAAHAVQLAGYEQDDAEIDRYAEMRPKGERESKRIEIESLGDADALVAPFTRQDMSPARTSPDDIEVTALIVQIVADSQALFTAFGQTGPVGGVA